jgi:acylglycerol lipase
MSGSKETYFATAWRPEAAATLIKGLMFVCHGFGEYVGVSYERVAERLVAKGIVFGHDHVGHGRSTGERMQVATDFKEDYVKAVLAHCKYVANKYKELGAFLPFFCLASSMGATIALLAALADPQLFCGLVLVAPLIQPGAKIANPVKIAVARAMRNVVPSFELAGLQDKSLITRDADEEERISKDMLGWKGGIKLRQGYFGYLALIELNAHLGLITASVLIMHGTADRVTRPEGSVELYNSVGSADKASLFARLFSRVYSAKL